MWFRIYEEMDEESKKTLLRIEQNDDTFTNLVIGQANNDYGDGGGDNNNINKGRFMSALEGDKLRLCTGIKGNKHITKLEVNLISLLGSGDIEGELHDGFKRNTSINELILHCEGRPIISGARRILEAYQTNNNLSDLCLLFANLEAGRGDEIMTTTLQCCTNLKTINLYACSITASMVPPMVEAMRGIHSLENLSLNFNIIGNAGCEALATLLEDPNCNLKVIQLTDSDIGNLGVIAIANSLTNNTKLQSLYLGENPITLSSVEDIFCRGVLCISSSISSICSSNHTLSTLTFSSIIHQHTLLGRLLQLNEGTNKRHVIMKKILQYHPHIDVKPLFAWDMDGEWTLKGLPYIIDWFNRAAVAVNDRGTRRVARAKDRVNYNVDQKKLSAIYEFAKAMPLRFVPTSHHTTVDDDNKKKRKRG